MVASQITFSTLTVSSLGINTTSPSTALDLQVGNIIISSVFTSTFTFTTSGTTNISVPFFISSVNFEMIGAGGATGLGTGGTAGYIRGVASIPAGVTSIKVVVGASGTTSLVPSGASYITVATTGPLLVIAGAGGSGGTGFGTLAGGQGGGGTFTSGVANGGDSSASAGFTGKGGTTLGGTPAGQSCAGGFAGAVGSNPSVNFEEAYGGSTANTNPGGSGYAGGGSGCGGGGGSSYINTTYVTVLESYAGGSVPGGTLSGYGRSGQSGYMTVTLNFPTSLIANGDIICRNVFQTSTFNFNNFTASTMTVSSILQTSSLATSTIQNQTIISSASGRILLGTGTPTYRFEINNGGGVVTSFANNGWRYGNGGGAANGPGQSDTISMKTQFGIWATIFYATSDRRIKTNITEIDDDCALQVVRKIKPVTFKYIDQINRHNELEYGFLAQDVKSILPHAVKTEVDFIPNIYDLGDVSTLTESTSLVTLRTKHLEDIQPKDTIQLLDLRENPLSYEVAETGISSMVVHGRVDQDVADYELTEEDMKNNIQKNTVFVYGKRVDDLNVLDKHAIFSVGIAAMQEMDRVLLQQSSVIHDQNKKIMDLQEKCKKLQNEIVQP